MSDSGDEEITTAAAAATAATTTTTTGGNAGTGTGSTTSTSTTTAATRARHDRPQYYVDNSNRNFEGNEPRIGAVLAAKGERVTAKAGFDAFREKLDSFIVRELKNGSDVVGIVRNMVDPNNAFEKNFMPIALTDTEKGNPVKEAILTQKIKNYVSREETMQQNITKNYGLIWGQSTETLNGMIRNLTGYQTKSDNYDVLWLLEELKKLTSGIDAKLNVHDTLHDAMIAFLTMRQGQNESNDDYMKRFRANEQTLKLAGGGHILCSPTTLDKARSAATD